MKHIELHVVESAEDQRLLNISGFDLLDDESCQNCLAPVGEVDLKSFISFVVLLDDESEWIVCANCADPVL